MSLADELLANGPNNGLSAALRDGIRSISRDQEVTFTRYVKMILPADGFVFWMSAKLIQPSSMPNGSSIDGTLIDGGSTIPLQVILPNGAIGLFAAGQGSVGVAGGTTASSPTPLGSPYGMIVKGSFHFASSVDQREDETITVNRVVFSTKTQIQDLITVSPDTLWLGQVDGVRFAFGQRGSYYNAAGINHYVGEAVYPALLSQIVDSPGQISTLPVVSNSLPFWLGLVSQCPMFPSFLVPPNAQPPYGAVHIEPGGTEALQAFPARDFYSNHLQLCEDKVRVTFYGLRNNQALDWQDAFFDAVANQVPTAEVIGIMGMPTPMRDAKRTQREMSVLATKKVFECRVSYYQTRTQNLARKLIKKAFMTLTTASLPH